MGEMPRDLSEEAVAEWVCFLGHPRDGRGNGYHHYTEPAKRRYRYMARAVLALVRAKAREAVMDAADGPVYAHCGEDGRREYDEAVIDAIVARVLGEETPRG